MTEEELEQLGRDSRNAQRLIEDEVFRGALKAITDESLSFLVTADPSNLREITRAQERVKVCYELLSQLAIKMDLEKAATARPRSA